MELTTEERRVLREMVKAGMWMVRTTYNRPDPVCHRLATLGLATGHRHGTDEHIPLVPFPTFYRPTAQGEQVAQTDHPHDQ